ncbi:MAG: PAS domain S-box protein [Phycisphaerales bacterium]
MKPGLSRVDRKDDHPLRRVVTINALQHLGAKPGVISLQHLIDALPVAIYLTDAEGRIMHFNQACVRLSGRTPQLGTDRWCVMPKLYTPDGQALPHDKCPMAVALKEKRVIENAEVIAEIPDGTRRWVMASPAPLIDNDGELMGGVNMLVDITSEKQSEIALRQSERELADFFDTSSIGLHWVGPDGIIQRANAAELQMLGYREDEYVGHHIADFHVDPPVIEDILQRLAAGERLNEYPARLRRKDGSICDVRITSSVLFDEDGKFLHTRCFTHDDTARKRSEDWLRRTAATLATLVEQSPLGIYTVDADFRIAHVSAGAMPAFQNVTPIIGSDFAEVMHTLWPKAFADEAIHIFRHTLETGERYVSPGLTEQRRDIGRIESYEWQVDRIVMADGRYGVVCYYFDSTRLKQANESLRTSEERFRMLADNMSQLAWTCTVLGEADWYNQRWLDYTGLTVQEMNSWGWTAVHHPDHLDRVIEGVHRAREAGETWEDTFPLRRHDGEFRWFLSRAVPIRDEEGNIVRWFGTNTDITDQLEHEDRMSTMMAELNHRVKNSLAVISAISQQTARRARSLDDFSRVFDARLQSIAKAHSLLTNTEWKGSLLGDIVHSELDLRIASPEQLTVSGPLLVLSPSQSLAMHMVIHELATNATKYGALLDDAGRIDVAWGVEKQESTSVLRMTWTETCSGAIAPLGEEGYGSELINESVTYELEGEVQRTFSPQGLRCELSIPLDPQTMDPKNTFEPAILHGPVPQSRGRVLLVEDNAAIGMAMAREIRAMGHNVLGPVRTLHEAMRLLARETPAVALLDVELNGTMVYPLAYILRDRGLPYALLTGYSRNDIPEDLRDSTILTKPVSVDAIADFISASLDGESSEGACRLFW